MRCLKGVVVLAAASAVPASQSAVMVAAIAEGPRCGRGVGVVKASVSVVIVR